MQNKIWGTKETARESGREDSKGGAAKLIYNNIFVVPDMIITAIYYN